MLTCALRVKTLFELEISVETRYLEPSVKGKENWFAKSGFHCYNKLSDLQYDQLYRFPLVSQSSSFSSLSGVSLDRKNIDSINPTIGHQTRPQLTISLRKYKSFCCWKMQTRSSQL